MIRFLLAALAALSMSSSAMAADASRPSLAQPAISPDGSEIVFVSGGDIWTVPAAGGDARLLVSNEADERRPLYSPDGKRLAFESDRSGNGDIYVLDLGNGGAPMRLTYDDGSESLDGWSADGRWIYYSSTTADISGMNDIFRVSVNGGTPMAVTSERYTNEFFAAPSPDGVSLLFNAHGIASGQWWRHGSSHIDKSEIWLLRDDASRQYRKIIDGDARSVWPMWSADGTHFFFVSDRGGAENLWSSDLSGNARKLTNFTDGRVVWPAISNDGRWIAFERDFGVWRFDVLSGAASQVAIALRGAPAAQVPEYKKLTGDFEEMALSPDGKKIALVVRGEVFAVSAADGGEAARVTRTLQAERHVAWAPDSKRIVYASTRHGASNLYLYDFTTNAETKLTDGADVDMKPSFSPDGKSIAFLRNGTELRILDVATKKDRLAAKASIDLLPPLESPRPFAWSPDGKWLAFLAQGDRMFRNAMVVSADGSMPSTAAQVSYLPNVSGDTISWSPDGTFLLFDSGQRTENGSLVRVDLVPHTPKFREEELRKLFEEETKKTEKSDTADAKSSGKKESDDASKKNDEKMKPVEIVTEGIRERMTLLPVAVDVAAQAISPDGKEVVLIARAEGAENLYLYSLDELAKEPPVSRQLTSTREDKSSPQFSPDGKTVYYLENGSIVSIPLEKGKGSPKTISVSASMEIDFESEKEVVFDQAWGWLARHFHDPNMNGVDWNAVRTRWAPYVAGARTPAELRRDLSLMIGELNSSHSGVRSGERPHRTTGRIGLRFDRVEYEKSGAFRIRGIVPLSPAAVTRKIAVGDYLVAIDGTPLTSTTPLAKLLDNQMNKEVRLTLAADASGARKRDVTVRPISQGAAKELIYHEWVEKNRAYVDKLSGGRLGYVHIPDMSFDSLLGLMTDLDAINMTRDGVVVDIRNNNGGFINAYALDMFSRHHYLNMTFRGLPTAPARTILGQRSLEKPTILLTNQHSLSDAEDFTEGYRAMKLGKTVGEPTAGWIIYTSNVDMIDGSSVRLPFITITTAGGQPMEMHPRPVDIEIHRAMGEDAQGHDSQLEAAVKELLSELGR